MALPLINQQSALVEWIKRELGWPSVSLEIDDKTILSKISDSIQYFTRYSADRIYRNALTIPLSAGIDEYTLPDEVVSIINFDVDQTMGQGVNRLFTVENTLWNEGFVNFRSNSGLVSWTLAQQYLETLKEVLVPRFFPEWDKYTKTLKITPKPTKNNIIAMVEVYTLWDVNVQSSVFNEIWVKKYALAKTKVILGQIRSKYSGISLPGGGELNGPALVQEGTTEVERLEELILEFESPPLGFYVG